MNPNTYQNLAQRTECDQEAASRRRLYIDNEESTRLRATRLSHAILGLTGEVGELAAALEHVIYYGQPWDYDNIKEEIGDCLWYLALACNAVGLHLEEVMSSNIAKLRERYPEKYTDVLAQEVNRNRELERDAICRGGYATSDASSSQPKQSGPNPLGHHAIDIVDIPHDDCQPLSADYDRYCAACKKVAIYKTNTAGLCPNCFAAIANTICSCTSKRPSST